MLEANPNLGWRDVKWILAKTAQKVDATNSGWTTNAASSPMNISYLYGFGLVDAQAAVNMAKSWTNLSTQKTATATSSTFSKCESASSCNSPTTSGVIDDIGSDVYSTITMSNSDISAIESVDVKVTLSHPNWGNLYIVLERADTSLTTQSILAINHDCYSAAEAVIKCSVASGSYTFTTNRHLGEVGDGTWKLRVWDNASADTFTGSMTSWELTLRGH